MSANWKGLVDKAIAILRRHIVPGGISDKDALTELYGVFDGTDFRACCDAEPDQVTSTKPRSAFLDLALYSGAVLTGKPDGSEPITVIFTIEAWRKFDAEHAAIQPATPAEPVPSAGWQDRLYSAMDAAFALYESSERDKDGQRLGMRCGDTQIGVEFAMKWFEQDSAAPASQPVAAVILPSLLEQSSAWQAVFQALDEVTRGEWIATAVNCMNTKDAAVYAIHNLAEQAKSRTPAPASDSADRPMPNRSAFINDMTFDLYQMEFADRAARQVPAAPALQDGHDQMLRDMLAIQDACGLHTDEYAPGSVIEYIKELEADTAKPAAPVEASESIDTPEFNNLLYLFGRAFKSGDRDQLIAAGNAVVSCIMACHAHNTAALRLELAEAKAHQMPKPLTQEVLDHCWYMYQKGQISADHTAKEVFEQTLQSFAKWLTKSAPGEGLAIPTWQERLPEFVRISGTAVGHADYMQAEIDDLRAALARTAAPTEVAKGGA